MAVTLPTVWYANYGNGSSTGYFAVPVWATVTAYTVGAIRRATSPTAANERTFICIVAGTSLASEPTWVNTAGAKTVEAAGPTWMECTGQPALNADLTNTPLSSANRSGAQVLGNLIQNNAGTFYFICTTAGTTGAGEPSYTLTAGVTTADNTCTWTCLGAVGSFTTAWGAPFSRLGNALATGLARVPAGGYLLVSSAHAETVAASTTLTNGTANGAQTQVVCIANGGSIPPTSATTGATYTVTGANGITLSGTNIEFNGVAFTSGTANPAFTIASTAGGFVRLRNCSVSCPSTAGRIIIGPGAVEWINTPVAFGNNAGSQGFGVSGNFTWRDTPSALSTTTAWPTNLFGAGGSGNGVVLCEGVDLSAFAGTNVIPAVTTYVQRAVFSHCKMPTITLISSVSPSINGYVVDLINSDTGGNTYNSQRLGLDCAQQVSTTAVMTGGASDGKTPFSWAFTAAGTRNLSWSNSFEAMPIVVWNATTGANVTITLEGAYVGTALPYNDDFWFDVLYFGTASSTLSTRGTCTKATALTTNTQWSASSQLWGGSAPARQNTTAYVRGDLIGVSSASGIVRLFVCTTAGTSNGSLPAGYASAVDGGTVTDNTATFTAVERFTMTLTLSAPQPQAAGYFYIYVKIANNGNGAGNYQTMFVDPKPVLS